MENTAWRIQESKGRCIRDSVVQRAQFRDSVVPLEATDHEASEGVREDPNAVRFPQKVDEA